MKNSTLIFRSIMLVSSILLAWFYPIAILLILLTALALGIFAYLVFCVLEFNRIWGEYGNEKYKYTIVPRKYNIIAVFIDWVNSFPPIIKKKDLEN